MHNNVWIFAGEKDTIPKLNCSNISLSKFDKSHKTISSNVTIIPEHYDNHETIKEICSKIPNKKNKIFVRFSMINDPKNNLPTNNVWIFDGVIDSGKHFISHETNMKIYETDENSHLPSSIQHQIIIKGKKYHHSIDDICSHCKNNERVILASFIQIK